MGLFQEDLEEKRKMDREASFQEMEKVFEPIRKFDRSFAGDEPERERRYKFTESDYNGEIISVLIIVINFIIIK